MTRWTEGVIRHRKAVIAVWFVLFGLGGFLASGLGDLLTNRFSVPGAESEKGFDVLKDRFGAQGDGFTFVVEGSPSADERPAFIASIQVAAERGARVLPDGKAAPVREAADGVFLTNLTTTLDYTDTGNLTEDVRAAIGKVPDARQYLTGGPAIMNDTEPISNEDIARGELIALPIAVLVLAFMLATVLGIAVPLLFAMATIPTTLGLVWVVANFLEMATYVQNIVTLIGLAIAIDYSMLVVFRYREELRRQEDANAALVTTMETAGHATIFSGITVALGLGLLVFMPLPFMQSMGIGGVLVPLVSIAAAATLLPAMLAVIGRRIDRWSLVPKRIIEKRTTETGAWARLAQLIMRRPVVFLVVTAGLMIALALPALGLEVTGGDNRGVPKTTEATKGLAVLERTLGPGTLAPHQIVIDFGRPDGAWSRPALDTQRDLAEQLRGDPEVNAATVQTIASLVPTPDRPSAEVIAAAVQGNLVDPSGRFAQVKAAGRQDSGSQAAKDLVARIRETYIPAAEIEARDIWVTGGPAFGVDFIDVVYGAFPFLVIAVLLLSYIVLLRAFRSVVLPLKAVLLNCLSVAATYGVLVLVFQEGLGTNIGLQESPQVEAWIPVFLFAMLFGLSMDYEVFLLSRIREEYDSGRTNTDAVAAGLQHTGRIITACALIMVAAFSGFTAGSFVGLQMFGLGLSVAILLDATVVRAFLVPATMKLLGDWNWYLPDRVSRVMRLERTARHALAAMIDTGPAGRTEIVEAIETRSHAASPRPFAVLSLEIEGASDALMVAACERAQNHLRPHDLLAVTGPGRLAVLLAEVGGDGEAYVIADRLLERLHTPYSIAGEMIEPPVHAALAIGPGETEALLDATEAALARAGDAVVVVR